MKITRTVKFAVYFPDARGVDLNGKEGLLYQIAKARSDVTRAANKIISALWALDQGVIEHPTKGDKTVSLRTLSYQALTGVWSPFSVMYEPTTRRAVSSAVKLGVAGLVFTRMKTDFKDIKRGDKSLSTFKSLPLIVAGSGVRVLPNGRISLAIWTGTRNNRVVVAPSRLRGGARAIFRRIQNGEYKAGDAKLFKDKRTGKWTLTLAWTGEGQEATGGLIAGLDLGVVTTATIAYLDSKTLKPQPIRDRVNIPDSTLRLWNRRLRERSRRLQLNKDDYALREGRGRQRKLRVANNLGDKVSNMVSTTVQQTAAAVAGALTRRGARLLVLEDLTGITGQKLREFEELEGRRRAAARRRFLQWQQGALRAAIRGAVEKAGIEVIEVQPAYTSKTCSSCGIIWSKTPLKRIAKTLKVDRANLTVEVPKAGLGRTTQSKFKCSCGYEGHADRNAAINIARRGVGGSSSLAAA